MPFFKLFSRTSLFRQRVYLDYASSTPIDGAMLSSFKRPPLSIRGVNPHALHKEGVQLSNVLSQARKHAASLLDVHSDEIIFTSGATESDNLAISGTINQWIAQGIDPRTIVVFSSELEHAAVAQTIEHFTARGVQHNQFPLSEDVVVDPKHIIIPDTAKAVLVSVVYVSNETGTIQPIAAIAKRIRQLRKRFPDVLFVFHTDATQAPAHAPLRVPSLGVDLMTLGATKLYCHKGVGLLYKRRSLLLSPLCFGGGHEFGIRPGTPPVELIAECVHALSHTIKMREKETARVKALQTFFESSLVRDFPFVRITAHDQERSPHISHIAIPGIDSELVVLELDARGIAVSAKSACKNEEEEESSFVVKQYGVGWGAVRFSFGRMTTKRQLKKALRALGMVFRKYKVGGLKETN